MTGDDLSLESIDPLPDTGKRVDQHHQRIARQRRDYRIMDVCREPLDTMDALRSDNAELGQVGS